jgi:hypothetical protein
MAVDVRPGLTLTFGKPRRLFGFSPPALSFGCAPNRCYAVTPDGERFYVRQTPPSAPPGASHAYPSHPELDRGAEGPRASRPHALSATPARRPNDQAPRASRDCTTKSTHA